MVRKGRYGSGGNSTSSEWGTYPTPSVPIRTKKGIALADRTGGIGKTWWSKRWIEVLESFGWGSRLQRGRSYARHGQVLELSVTPGKVTARVQGSRPQPYVVSMTLSPMKAGAWEMVARALNSDAGLIARLLAGEVPEEMEGIFRAASASLLPRTARDLETECSCPDTANPCKHIAAVHYLLAERLDQDPFLVFRLRGKEREEVIGALRGAGVSGEVSEKEVEEVEGEEREVAGASPTPADLLSWWTPGPRFAAAASTPHRPAVENAVLRRLGDPSFCSQSEARRLNDMLKEVYRRVSDRAISVAEPLAGEGNPSTPPSLGVAPRERSADPKRRLSRSPA